MTCRSYRNEDVAIYLDYQLPNVGVAHRQMDGSPAIVVNPNVTDRFSDLVTQWWFAHECAHHALPPRLNTESNADCFGIRELRRVGLLFDPSQLQAFARELASLPGSPSGHLPGPARARRIATCALTGDASSNLPDGARPSVFAPPAPDRAVPASPTRSNATFDRDPARTLVLPYTGSEQLRTFQEEGWHVRWLFWGDDEWHIVVMEGPSAQEDLDWRFGPTIPTEWMQSRTEDARWSLQSVDRSPGGEWAVLLSRTASPSAPNGWSWRTSGSLSSLVSSASTTSGSGLPLYDVFDTGERIVSFQAYAGNVRSELVRSVLPSVAFERARDEFGFELVSVFDTAGESVGMVFHKPQARDPKTQRLGVSQDPGEFEQEINELARIGFRLAFARELDGLIYAIYELSS